MTPPLRLRVERRLTVTFALPPLLPVAVLAPRYVGPYAALLRTVDCPYNFPT